MQQTSTRRIPELRYAEGMRRCQNIPIDVAKEAYQHDRLPERSTCAGARRNINTGACAERAADNCVNLSACVGGNVEAPT